MIAETTVRKRLYTSEDVEDGSPIHAQEYTVTVRLTLISQEAEDRLRKMIGADPEVEDLTELLRTRLREAVYKWMGNRTYAN